jgi:hypothetical protein
MMLLVFYAARIYTQLENMHAYQFCMPPSFGFELVNGAISNMEGGKSMTTVLTHTQGIGTV